jgi:hypothetical protein
MIPKSGTRFSDQIMRKGKWTMRTVYMIVTVLAVVVVVANHLTSPSSGRAVSPEDFAGACAPCPSAKK